MTHGSFARSSGKMDIFRVLSDFSLFAQFLSLDMIRIKKCHSQTVISRLLKLNKSKQAALYSMHLLKRIVF